MTRTLNETETRALITAGKVGRLGCVDDGEPYVVPINYLFEDGAIYGHSLLGRKIRALRACPRACLQVDQVESDFRWRSAIAFGSFEEIGFEREREQVLHKLLQSFPLLTPVESVIPKDAAPPEVIVFRIRVDRVTGLAEE
ncbi:MAG TPA: pyridoxamine 5'-phosphate oxidase family protein [Pyrinomonadaceae bacterium]|nr:pyridoxamine 5'-phosphate oxidase family protein [Pyrinomonadaceae bacterium]